MRIGVLERLLSALLTVFRQKGPCLITVVRKLGWKLCLSQLEMKAYNAYWSIDLEVCV